MRAAQQGTADWLAALRADGLLEANEDVGGLTLLTGGLYYGLQPAWQTVFGAALPENFIGVRRRLGAQGQWVAEDPYESFEAPCRTVFIGDTVASGASALQGLRAFANWAGPRGLKRVHFFSACGSGVGGQRIIAAGQALGLEVTFTHGLAAFGMSAQGWQLPDTDLPWLHTATVTAPHHRQRAAAAFQGQPVCAIGDWGLRCKNPRAYLHEWQAEAAFWGLTQR